MMLSPPFSIRHDCRYFSDFDFRLLPLFSFIRFRLATLMMLRFDASFSDYAWLTLRRHFDVSPRRCRFSLPRFFRHYAALHFSA